MKKKHLEIIIKGRKKIVRDGAISEDLKRGFEKITESLEAKLRSGEYKHVERIDQLLGEQLKML